MSFLPKEHDQFMATGQKRQKSMELTRIRWIKLDTCYGHGLLVKIWTHGIDMDSC